jgi:hypothetical protein
LGHPVSTINTGGNFAAIVNDTEGRTFFSVLKLNAIVPFSKKFKVTLLGLSEFQGMLIYERKNLVTLSR